MVNVKKVLHGRLIKSIRQCKNLQGACGVYAHYEGTFLFIIEGFCVSFVIHFLKILTVLSLRPPHRFLLAKCPARVPRAGSRFEPLLRIRDGYSGSKFFLSRIKGRKFPDPYQNQKNFLLTQKIVAKLAEI
jgi:hypothetical protein